ncbi:G-protein coupled receptor 35-like [Gouania willdenowi]|uniref:G-protein coupled receptor 35-like n=1 Tax=Gouania willdenowi TaxID=441366 RepID=UPI0010551F0D|nr:G-protein coupled receptor 35-like [Gouania willdenowi]
MIADITVWTTFSALFSVVGCPACAAVLWELFKRHKRGNYVTPNDVFMLNITIMDLLFLLFIPLGLFNFLFWLFQPVQMWSDFLYDLNLTGRPLLTACMCFDSYLAVVHPVFYHTHRSPTVGILVAAALWAITLAKGTISTVIDELSHSPWTMFMYVIALPVIIICNSSVLWTLRKSDSGRTGLHPMKKKALQIITNNMIVTVVVYLPPVMVYIVGPLIFSEDKMYDCYLAIPILVMLTAGSSIMSLLWWAT